MRILLVCPSNMLYMPYVKNYETILQENKVDYEIINWDRLNIENNEGGLSYTYRDLKTGHRRSYIDYFKYRAFIKKRLRATKYDKIIVFGIQLSFFLADILQHEYKGNYIIDIRDYNKIVKFFNLKKVIFGSVFTVLSSPGFKKWLPKFDRYLINHNTQVTNLNELRDRSSFSNIKTEKINISYIGSLRNYNINIDFINSVKNNNRISLYYHGEGIINKTLKDYLFSNGINNVFVTGRYNCSEEDKLYSKSDLINILIPNDSINSRTLLPNRLYKAASHFKPIVAYEGTYLSHQVKKYNLGIVLSSFNKLEDNLSIYLENFDLDAYKQGRNSFFNKVIRENQIFEESLIKFVGL